MCSVSPRVSPTLFFYKEPRWAALIGRRVPRWRRCHRESSSTAAAGTGHTPRDLWLWPRWPRPPAAIGPGASWETEAAQGQSYNTERNQFNPVLTSLQLLYSNTTFVPKARPTHNWPQRTSSTLLLTWGHKDTGRGDKERRQLWFEVVWIK